MPERNRAKGEPRTARTKAKTAEVPAVQGVRKTRRRTVVDDASQPSWKKPTTTPHTPYTGGLMGM